MTICDRLLYRGKLIVETDIVNQRNSFHLHIKKKELEKVQIKLIILALILSQNGIQFYSQIVKLEFEFLSYIDKLIKFQARKKSVIKTLSLNVNLL